MHVGAQQAVAIGTFLNEFVTNSYKHAFPDGRAGTVSVTLAHDEDGMARLVCADDGVGMSDTEAPQGSGLGMKIAQVVCLELNCDLSLQSTSQGLSATLAFEVTPA
jgi:two-component sensor histidine kinase